MDENAKPYELPSHTAQRDQGRWKKLTLIVILLSSPTMILLTHFTMGMTAALTFAIVLNLAIRSFKRSQPSFRILPFAVLAMMIGGALFLAHFLSLPRRLFFK